MPALSGQAASGECRLTIRWGNNYKNSFSQNEQKKMTMKRSRSKMVGGLDDTETLRQEYRPGRIRTLFVGESAPSGGTFFYRQDSQAYRNMQLAFNCPKDFLTLFKKHGCFFDDLVLTPINCFSGRERRVMRESSVPDLTKRLDQYRPEVIIVVMKAIGPYVEEALANSGLQHTLLHVVSFPGNGRQKEFLRQMKAIIPNLPGSPWNSRA